jgi:2',3'-cyclic-nucleotide 2'-phosphodiesterase (5'-nucleotidase family)
MTTYRSRRTLSIMIVLAILVSLFTTAAVSPQAGTNQAKGPSADKVIFFAADGLRQDLVEKYAAEGSLTGLEALLRTGSRAAGNGLLTQAPPNTGAGWYSLSTGAWAGVHGSTNNTFHINGAPFANRTGAFDSGVVQAESLAQAAERGGKKVAQIEWAGGRVSAINGPTVDYRGFFSGRGVATNYISPLDLANFVAAFGLQFDHPAGFAGQAPFAQAAPAPASGWTDVPSSWSDPMEMRLRVLDFGVDKYGLNAYIFDSSDDNTVNYDQVLFSFDKSGSNSVGILAKGQWADVKVAISGGAFDGLTGGMLVKVEELTPDLSQVRLFHTSVTRANASWPTWGGEAGFSDFAEFIAQTFPTSTAADYAILEAGIVSEETYVEQGLYWEQLYHPLTEYILNTYQPDLVMMGYPITDEFQHQFMGLVTPLLPNGQANPAFDDVQVNGTPDGRAAEREGFLQRAYQGAANTLNLVQSLMGKKPATFVAADHGFAPQFLAIDASQVLVELGLLSRPQTSNCRPASGETIGMAKACWAGGTVQIYLNLAGRDPAGGFMQVPANEEAATVAMIKTAFENLSDPNDWTGDGLADGWMVMDRVYTKAEARYIPNGPGSSADMAHPTRTGDVVAFSYPPYQFDAATPGTLVALSAFFGQHGYVPDVQVLDANVNMRAAFFAQGEGIANNRFVDARTIDLAPTIAFLLGIPMPQGAQGRVLTELLRGGPSLSAFSFISFNDFHGQLEPTTFRFDGRNVSVGGAAFLASMFDEEMAGLPGQSLLLSAGDLVGATPPISGLLADQPTIDVANAWGLAANAYGNHEFDYGLPRLMDHQARANFPFLAVNIVEEATGLPPAWVQTSRVFEVNGVQVGVIGAALENTPELVSAGATEGLQFMPVVPAVQAESEKLRKEGVRVQILIIHDGSNLGSNALANSAAIPWEGPLISYAAGLQDTTIDVISGGHTHRVTNTMVGRILVTEGYNAGTSYSVHQLFVTGGDVVWAGASTRIAKNLGVAARPDVMMIVDEANAETAVLRNQVIGTQTFDILRAPSRLFESAMGNLVTDAMLSKYPTVEAAYTNSGGLRADLVCSPPSAGEADCEITWGEMFAVLPFGNRTVIETLSFDQMEAALINGFTPFCDPAFTGGTGRFPQVAGMRVTFHCDGITPVVDGIWKTPDGIAGAQIPFVAGDSIRIVTNDFMYTGGDGYTVFLEGTDVQFPGDGLLELAVDYIRANSPVAPVVEGRITGP